MKTMNKLALVLCALCCTPLYAEQSPSERLQKLLNAVDTYQADFHQRIKDADGHPVASAKGSVRISRPNQFVWHTKTPDKILVIADGKYLWNYDIDLSQVTQQDLKPVLKNSPAGILAGESTELLDTFEISDAKRVECRATVDQCFKLLPQSSDATYSSVLLGFHDGKLIEIRMNDALGQDVQTRFSDTVLNEPLSPKQFRFTPPKGVDVIRS